MALEDTLRDIDEGRTRHSPNELRHYKNAGSLCSWYEDQGLSFERGTNKKAKTIETCVLYADIRNSTTLSHTHSHEKMARLYTAFTKSILTATEWHGGVIRNIIGDRVMVVFPQNDCFKKAIETAISINTIASRIINRRFSDIEFKCGVGIDHGEMTIVKAGIPKQEPERTNYKNLIWIGKPANIASKLTDIANKEIISTTFKVSYYPYNYMALSGLSSLFAPRPQSGKIYRDDLAIDELTGEQFAAKLSWNDVLGVCYSGGKFVKFESRKKT